MWLHEWMNKWVGGWRDGWVDVLVRFCFKCPCRSIFSHGVVLPIREGQ